ncbi:chaplin [Streptomyces sp. NPDC048297]|uniref:chaplin n=1 Tax=Streptomyces sp. NPDC048297 TaxID=3365531 RepID=UPI00371AB0E1
MSRIAKAAVVALGTGAVVIGGAGLALADSGAAGVAAGSPGVLSGNLLEVPVHVPVNVCGNTVDVIGLLNPAFGEQCANQGDGLSTPGTPGTPGTTDNPGTPGGYGDSGFSGYGN